MRDVIVVAVTAAFFALCVAYVRWCDRIIGPGPDDLPDDDLDEAYVDGVVDVDAAGATPVAGGVLDAEAVRA